MNNRTLRFVLLSLFPLILCTPLVVHAQWIPQYRNRQLRLGSLLRRHPHHGNMKRALVSSLILFVLTGFSFGGVWDLEQTPATATFYGAYNDDHLGTGMAVGDVNGDGQLDLLLSASGWDPDSTTQYLWGIAYLFYGGSLLGAKDLRRDSADFTVVGYPDGAHLGVSAAIGDVNGDGKGDLIIGTAVARGESLPGVVVFFGSDLRGTIRLPGNPPDYAIYPPGLGFDVGSGLTVGDVNGDGIGDIIMPAPFSHGPNNRDDCGAVYIVYGSQGLSGRRDLAVDSADITIYGADAHDELGFRGAQDPPVSVGDVNSDGIGDLVVTAFGADGPGNSRGEMTGEAYVFYGGSLPRIWDLNVRPADLIVYGKRSGSSLDVGVIGDVNGDGYGDIFLGSEGEAGTGEAYLLYGGNPPPRGVKDLAVDSVDYTIVGVDTKLKEVQKDVSFYLRGSCPA